MDFFQVLEQVVTLLKRHQRVSYRALKLQFQLDDAYLDTLKEELIDVQQVAVDQDGKMLLWTGGPSPLESERRHNVEAERCLPTLLPTVIGPLRGEGRVSYRTLQSVFGIDDTSLEAIREELVFRRLAIDENGQGLIWTDSAASLPDASPLPIAPASGRQPTHSAPEAERRQLTVMFCDLADSTRLSQQLDPEDLREVVRAYQTSAADVVHQYEGHIAQYLGDGLLIYFGWPQAHEDDVQRALHAGPGIVDTIANGLNPRLQQDKGVHLMVRIGVHTGPVVVGAMGGSGRYENLATGETVNIGARLEGLAASNTMLISSVTARLV